MRPKHTVRYIIQNTIHSLKHCFDYRNIERRKLCCWLRDCQLFFEMHSFESALHVLSALNLLAQG